MKRDSLLPQHPSPYPTPSLSFCELNYLQSKEMPSRVNKSGAAPVVGGAQRWVGRSPGLHLFVLQLSRAHLYVWARFSHWCWEPMRPWERRPLWCMSESLGVHIECTLTRPGRIPEEAPIYF